MAKRVTKGSNASDAITRDAVNRVLVNAENARDPEGEHPALRGLGDLPGIRKDAKGSVLAQEAQTAPKDVSAADLVLSKGDMSLAEKILGRFKEDAGKYVSLKEKVEAAKGGLSTIMLEMAQRASERTADHPQWRWAFFGRMCSYAEGKAIADYKSATNWHTTPGAKEPTVREAINPSWQTYKSQIIKSLRAGYDPRQFENGTAFREVLGKAQNANRGTRSRSNESGVESAAVAVEDPMISGALIELTKKCTAVAEGKRDEVADIIMDAAQRIQALLSAAKRSSRAKTADATHAASM